MGVKALLIYTIATGFAVIFGLICGNLFQPGKGMPMADSACAGVKTDVSAPSLMGTLVNVVPVNPFSAIAEGNVLKVAPGSPVAMAYAMIFGIDALHDRGRTACNVTGDLAVSCVVAQTENEMDRLAQKNKSASKIDSGRCHGSGFFNGRHGSHIRFWMSDRLRN